MGEPQSLCAVRTPVRRRSYATGLAAATVILLWASSFVAVKVALVDIGPGPLALARYAVAALVFLALLLVRRCALPPAGDLVRMAAGGGVGIALYNFTLNSGQRTVGAGVASLLVNTVPIWTSLLSVALLKERISGFGWLGALISFTGVALISLEHGGWSGLAPDTALILAAALSQALYFVIVKPLLARYHPIDLTSYAVWFGLLFLVPVVAIALGWIVLDELPSPVAFAGGAIAILGVGLGRRGSR